MNKPPLVTFSDRANGAAFDPGCRACPRLDAHLQAVRDQHPRYHARPVAPFGDPAARLLIVGLAPGLHGANATGRPFTGDAAGVLLYRQLHRHGFSNQPEAEDPGDGLQLWNARITNAVKCLPPGNKPLGEEIRRCNRYLAAELAELPRGAVILALGQVAHQAVLRAAGAILSRHPFAHGARYRLPAQLLISAYHPSQYNVRTGRITEAMLDAVFVEVRKALNQQTDDPL